MLMVTTVSNENKLTFKINQINEIKLINNQQLSSFMN